SHPRVPAAVQGAGRVRQSVLRVRRRTEGPGLHHDEVENINDKGAAGPRRRPRRRRNDNNRLHRKQDLEQGRVDRPTWMVKSGFVKVHLVVDTKRGKILWMQ